MGKKKNRNKELFFIFCRMVGPGGTTVTFSKNNQGGLTAVWENENCPYEDTYEGHNISTISKEEWERIKKK